MITFGLCLTLNTHCLAQEVRPLKKQSSQSSFTFKSEIEKQVTPFLHPFITTDAYRDMNEEVIKKGQNIEIWKLDSLETGVIRDKICTEVRHLLFGRLERSLGIQNFLKRNPQYKEVHWILYRIQTQVSPNLNNQYQQTRKATSVARLIISRQKALLFNASRLKNLLVGQACVPTAKMFLDEIWISDQVKVRRQRASKFVLEKRQAYPLKTKQSITQ